MKRKDPALWAACRIHRILTTSYKRPSPSLVQSLSRLLMEQEALDKCWRMLDNANRHDYPLCATILRRRLLLLIAAVHDESRIPHPIQAKEVPPIGEILQEIRHLHDEFDEVEINGKEGRIAVTIDRVLLEEVDLGPFDVQLDLERLSRRRDSSAFVIVAKDPNPASSNSACKHPHVQDESLCAGDATAPIAAALNEGRIGDAFQLVDRVLHTYNSSSAYVSLSEWDSVGCNDCGTLVSTDHLYYCQHCDKDFCDDCARTCDRCNETVCVGCSDINDDSDRLCPTCMELSEEEDEEPSGEDDLVHNLSREPQLLTENNHEQLNDSDTCAATGEAQHSGSAPGGDDDDGKAVEAGSCQAA